MQQTRFRTYDLAVAFYRQAQGLRLPRHLKDQMRRAASSIALNLAEGSAKPTTPDRLRFYRIAFGSLREVQAILELCENVNLKADADKLGAHMYSLCRSLER